MELKQLIQDEDAVSPVIGVILMVAITVILAAVIGTFVLGLGDQVQSSAPNANFQFEYNNGVGGDVDITHNGGQDVDADNLQVQIDDETWGPDDGVSGVGTEFSGDWSAGTGDGATISTGATENFDFDSSSGGEDVLVIWSSSSGGSSNTIGSSTVPSA